MSMQKFTVDTANKRFVANFGVTSFDVKVDLYSDAKEHWLDGGNPMKFLFPIRSIGGDPVGGGVFAGDLYFLRDGWRVRPYEASHTLNITGNLFLDEGESGGAVVQTLGPYTVLVNIRNSSQVLAVSTGGTVAPTQQQIRDAMALATGETPASGSVDDKLDDIATEAAAAAAATNVYSAEVTMTEDHEAQTYIYTVLWTQDGRAVQVEGTSPTIQAVAVTSGATLFGPLAMTWNQDTKTYALTGYSSAYRPQRGITYVFLLNVVLGGSNRTDTVLFGLSNEVYKVSRTRMKIKP